MESNDNVELPDDVLYEIFKYLDGKSLKQAALVCKRQEIKLLSIYLCLNETKFITFSWNDVIENTSATMKHFRLNIKADDSSEDNLAEVMSLQRKFQEMQIEMSRENCKLLEKVASHHGSTIVKLTCSSSCFNARNSFSSILANVPNIVELHLSQLSLHMHLFLSHQNKMKLSSLKELKINFSTNAFLENISAPQLETLEITSSTGNSVEKFLTTCTKLQTLIFRNDLNYLRMFQSKKEIPFNLKVLEITNDEDARMDGLEHFVQKFSNLEVLSVSTGMVGPVYLPNPPNVHCKLTKLDFTIWWTQYGHVTNDNYVRFLESQANNLKEMKSSELFCDLVELDEEYFTIFTRMKCLEKLTFDRKNPFPRYQEFYNELQPNETIKELRFTKLDKVIEELEAKQDIFLRGILPKLPNLEVFEAPHRVNFPDFLPYLSTNNPKLTTLSLWTLENYQAEVKFRFLKTLNLKFIRNDETHQKFLRDHPTIETVKVEETRTSDPINDYNLI